MVRKITVTLLCCLVIAMALVTTNCSSASQTTEPMSPTTETAGPTTEPTSPTTEPMSPTTEPTAPTTEPTVPTTETQLPAPGRTAPDFELQNLEGQTVSLRDYRGSRVMLNFWATWCGFCVFEMPFFQEIYEDTEWQATGLVILAINAGESSELAGGFMEDNGFTFPVLLDETTEVSVRYNIRGYPTTFFIDESGIIRYIDVGAFRSKADIEQRLDVLIEDES